MQAQVECSQWAWNHTKKKPKSCRERWALSPHRRIGAGGVLFDGTEHDRTILANPARQSEANPVKTLWARKCGGFPEWFWV